MRRRDSLIAAMTNCLALPEMDLVKPTTLTRLGRRSSALASPLRSESCVIRIFPPDYFLDHQHQHQSFVHDGFSTVATRQSRMLRRRTVVPGGGGGGGSGCQMQASKHEPLMDWSPHRPTPVYSQCSSTSGGTIGQTQRKLIMRSRAASHHHAQTGRERRSRSQPQQFRMDSMPDAERYSVDSETSASNDSGIRSSTHSTASSGACSSVSAGLVPDEQMLIVEAVWDHVAMLADELPFAQGDIITVLDATSNSGLWYGMCRDRTGWFPASYVKLRSEESVRPGPATPLRDDEFPPAVRYQRRRVVEELMETERDYVKLLQDLVHGFLEQCRRRRELFTEERVQKIFGNIAAVATLHVKLLSELEAAFDNETPENSLVANAFLRNSRSFGIYTEYCNNRPISCAELAVVERQPQYRHFFEACRLLRGMSKLTLEGFLLTPVQRICRYPLQLFELLKATPANHVDRIPLEQAHRTMRAVAAHINDAKRRVDAIQKIILWQKNVHGFRGPDIIENNHRTLISGELHCRALMKRSVQWSKAVHVYLFDQSVVLCKKDVLKKNSLVFKERMSLQTATVVDLNDGKEPITGAVLKNSFKLTGPVREYIFTCPDPATKGLWLESLRNRPRPMPPTDAEKRLALVMLP